MRLKKLNTIALTTAALSLSLSALDINSSEASVTPVKPASTVEIVSTEMNNTTKDKSTERPSVEEKTTEVPTTEKKSEENKIEIPKSSNQTPNNIKSEERPVKEPAKEVPVQTQPITPIPKVPNIPQSTPKAPSTHPVTTELPVTPAPPSAPVAPAQPVQVNPAPVENKSDTQVKPTRKPDNFCPGKGEKYYTELDKHVEGLVTAKIEKFGDHKPTIAEAAEKEEQAKDTDLQLDKPEKKKTSGKHAQSKQQKDEESASLESLPDTGEVTSLLGYMAALIFAGSILIRKNK
ncbi:hypothetical protein [Macrococcus equi]|uniref:hypothetical protein n=1 Tax=Macrococcus equi TaxID=3395462 RepID=UPI0039BDCE15